MKNRLFAITLLLSVCAALFAQGTGFDLQVMSDEDITGSSRYVGLGGAMAALGGDVSAVKDNPAALGVFRRSEATLSIGTDIYRDGKTAYSYNIPAINGIIHIDKGRKTGVIAHNLMFAYQRQKRFHTGYSADASGLESSQTDVMAALSEGLTYDNFRSSSFTGIAALAYAGYDGYLIDTVPGAGGKTWQSLEGGKVNANIRISETGYVDDYSFGWGMNIEHRWYVGVGVYFRMLSYTKYFTYGESFESGNRFNESATLSASGLGIGANAGVIWRPVQNLRVALALQTPTVSSLKFSAEGSIASTVADTTHNCTYYPNDSESATMRLPFRLVTGASWQFGQRGLVSLEYDYAHRKLDGMRDQHTFKLGAELAATNKLFIDFGYAAKLYGRYQGTNKFVLDWDSPRMDTDQREYGLRHFASAGFSYRNNWLIVGLAYQYSLQNVKIWAHEYQNEPMAELADQQHRIVVTLGLRYGN